MTPSEKLNELLVGAPSLDELLEEIARITKSDEPQHNMLELIKYVQYKAFKKELKCIAKQMPVPEASELRKFAVFVDDEMNGLIQPDVQERMIRRRPK